jgi:hypothetical protein
MAILAWPSDVRVGTASFSVEYDVQINVMRNGSITTYGLPGARWTCSLSFPPVLEDMQGPAVEALLVGLEGGANRLQMIHWRRPFPRGTLRGVPVVSQNAASGSKQILLGSATTGTTLKKGDILGILGQWVMVMADAVAVSNTMTVDIKPPLRNAVTVGTPVTWNKPAINWIPQSPIAGPFHYSPNGVNAGLTIDLVEAY